MTPTETDLNLESARQMRLADEHQHRRTIPIAEIFGPTLQGEGLLAGRPTYFVRVGGCDYRCEWCDTDHAVLPEMVRELPRFTQAEIWEKLRNYAASHPGPDWLAISGGNPGLYDLGLVVDEWQRSGSWTYQRQVTVETQGSRWQPWFNKVNVLTVSPKPPSSGLSGEASMRAITRFFEDSTYDEYQSRAQLNDAGIPPDYYNMVLKCIVFDEVDYQFARALHSRYPLIPFYLSTGTAMGGLSGRWIPPAIPDLDPSSDLGIEFDKFKNQREHPEMDWTPRSYVDSTYTLLRRYRWLAERAMNDDRMADVAIGVQQHCLLWGINTRGV